MGLFRAQVGQNKAAVTEITLSLAGLVLAAVLPLLVFGSGVAWLIVDQKRSAVTEDLAGTARALQIAVDRELLNQFTAMEVLASDTSLDTASLADFQKRADRAVKANHKWLHLALVDPRTHRILIGSQPTLSPSPESLS